MSSHRALAAIARLFMVVMMVVLVVLAWSMPVGALEATLPRESKATLVGPKADAPIPLYLRPAANQPNVGYGMSGDGVTVLEQVASFLPEADQRASWNHIRLNEPPYTEGWVQGRFLSGLAAPTLDEDPG